jgi:hypothetical protein
MPRNQPSPLPALALAFRPFQVAVGGCAGNNRGMKVWLRLMLAALGLRACLPARPTRAGNVARTVSISISKRREMIGVPQRRLPRYLRRVHRTASEFLQPAPGKRRPSSATEKSVALMLRKQRPVLPAPLLASRALGPPSCSENGRILGPV